MQTYAELRSKQQDAEPVVAGALLYVNELHLSSTDMAALKQEVRRRQTEVLPEPGSADEKAILSWTGGKVPGLSFEYRLRRALRSIVVSEESIKKALVEFGQIESIRKEEASGSSI